MRRQETAKNAKTVVLFALMKQAPATNARMATTWTVPPVKRRNALQDISGMTLRINA
jgi:hypothetical protein